MVMISITWGDQILELREPPLQRPDLRSVYTFRPGDMMALVEGLGIAVRHGDGRTILFGPGRPGHPVELDALCPLPEWRAPG